MKKMISLLLVTVLGLSCLIPALAENETREPVLSETTAAAQTSAAPPATQPAGTPVTEWTTAAVDEKEPTTAAPAPAAGEETTAAESAAPEQTVSKALKNQYNAWKFFREFLDERGSYNKAFRRLYADDPDLTVVDHLVFLKVQGDRSIEPHYALVDYFDTDEAEAAATTLHIPAKVNGLPVWIVMYRWSDWADGIVGSGYSNNTVTEVILDEGVAVAAYAFKNFTALKTVKIPSTAKDIGYSAFEDCKNLKKIVGAEHVAEVHSSAFSGCKKLASFPHMETLKTIEGNAFSGCAFKKLTLSGNALLSVGDEDNYSAWRAFADNKKLTSVAFLDGSKKKNLVIGFSTFWGCTALKTVIFPKKCKEIVIEDNAFYGCTSLKWWPVNPEKITEIWRFAFAGCTSLEHVMLPAGIKVVSEDAFKDCKNLKSLDLRSENIDLLSRRCDSGTSYQTDDYNGVSTNFVKFLPKTCTVYVANKDMKVTVKAHGCKGKVQIKVPVGMPKNIRAEKKGKNYTLKWSKVKNADGYRVYFYPYSGKRTYKNVRGGATALTLKNFSPDKYHSVAVKAFRVVDGDVSWGTPLFGAPGAMEKK